jgi:hypothetical protein
MQYLVTRLALWMGAAFGVSLALACTVFAIKGISPDSLGIVLHLTARWSFILFWMAYTSRALVTLFGPSLALVAKNGREFGLAFAASMLVHLGTVGGLFLLTWRAPFARWLVLFFLTAAFWTYLLALFSFNSLAKALGAKLWRIMRVVGMNYILFAFALDFISNGIHSPAPYGLWRLVEYVPFAVMSVSAPFLAFAAAIYRRREDGDPQMKLGSGPLRVAGGHS